MNHFCIFLVVSLAVIAAGKPRPESDEPEAREGDGSIIDSQDRPTEPINPVMEYLRSQVDTKNPLKHGTRREITHFEVFPRRQQIVTARPKTDLRTFQRDPNKTPLENFNGYIVAGRRPEDNLVSSPVLTVNSGKNNSASSSYTKVDMFPAVAVVINNYDEKGRLRNSVTRYEPADLAPSSDKTRQQITWPYAGYFPILIKDPFLTAFNALSTGMSFSFSSLVEYGPEADICRARESKTEHAAHVRKTRATKVTIADPDKGMATIRLEDPEEASDGGPELTVRKGGVAIAGPGGHATAYTGGTAIVGPYGTIYKTPKGVAIAGPYSRIINITDDTGFTEILRMYEAAKKNKTVISIRNNKETGFKPVRNYFSYKANAPVTLLKLSSVAKARSVTDDISRRIHATRGQITKEWQELKNKSKEELKGSSNETKLVLAPRSKAEAGKDGVALSAPVSYAIVQPGHKADIVFQPETSASAGPGGLAHAYSDLFITYMKNEREARRYERILRRQQEEEMRFK